MRTWADHLPGTRAMNPFEALSRLSYSTGQLLTAADLQDEQAYWRQRASRHLRFLHGWGVVAGMQVQIQPSTSGLQLRVQPGLAIDCAGNELALGHEVLLALPASSLRQYVVISLHETPAAPVPMPSLDDEGEMVHTRVIEDVHVALSPHNPAAGHRRMGPGTPGCGLAHGLCIASVAAGRSGPKVTLQARVRRRTGAQG